MSGELFDPDAVCEYPSCGMLIDEHSFRLFREHNPAMLLPYEPVEAGPIEQIGPDGVIATSVIIKAMVVSVADPPPGMKQHHPALGFTFYGIDGREEVGRFTLVMDSTSMRSLRQIVGSAIDGALKAARRGGRG